MFRTSALILVAVTLQLVMIPAFSQNRKVHVIKSGDTPALLAKKYKVSYEEIARFNNMSTNDVLKVGKKLEIPFHGEAPKNEYKVKNGDSVARIADFHGVSQDDLRAANGLKKNDHVKPGQILKIPESLRSGASKGHIVRKGDTVSSVAKQYGIKISDLTTANKLEKNSPLSLGKTLIIPDEISTADGGYRPPKTNTLLVTGRKVQGGVKHTVQEGQSLWIIARAYNTSGERILKANGIEGNTPLSTGQEILIPGAKTPVPVRVKGFRVQPIHFVSVWNNESATLRLFNDNGKINPKSRKILSELSGERKKVKQRKLLHPRLIHMIQRVAERYPGKTIEVVSGYRPNKSGKRDSVHNLGHALDFRVQGVERKELFNFIKELPNVGAGYYPNSVFVHMDVRKESAFWVDFSGIGESPRYGKNGAPEIDPSAAAEAAADAE